MPKRKSQHEFKNGTVTANQIQAVFNEKWIDNIVNMPFHIYDRRTKTFVDPKKLVFDRERECVYLVIDSKEAEGIFE